MELRHLRYAVAVADAGSMTRAAQALHVVQQALSQQIADLERELHVSHFERHARGVRPTAAGARFVSDARDILAAADAVVARVRAPVRAPLRLGVVDYGGGTALVRAAVAAYDACGAVASGPLSVEPTRSTQDATSPSRAVVLDARPVVQQPDAVRTGALDVGFWCDAFGPPVADTDSTGSVTLQFEPLLVDPNAGALLPAEHPLARRGALNGRDLAALPLVAHAAAPWALAMEDELRRLRAAGWRGRIGYELPDGADVIRLVVGRGFPLRRRPRRPGNRRPASSCRGSGFSGYRSAILFGAVGLRIGKLGDRRQQQHDAEDPLSDEPRADEHGRYLRETGQDAAAINGEARRTVSSGRHPRYPSTTRVWCSRRLRFRGTR